MRNVTDHKFGMRPQPDQPAGWLTLNNGDRYCPPCRKNLSLLALPTD